MANKKSAQKKIRKDIVRRLRNRYVSKTTRNAVKALKNTTDKTVALTLLPKVTSLLDKLAKRNVIHKNKAANLKSAVALHVNSLA